METDEYSEARSFRGAMARAYYSGVWYVTFDGDTFFAVEEVAGEVADSYPHCTKAFFTVRQVEVQSVLYAPTARPDSRASK